MAIREDIVLDPTKGIKGLDEMDRATVKYARKQKRLWKENQDSIDAIGDELRTLKRLRDTANDPRSVKRYNKAISRLENQQEELRQEAERYGRAMRRSSDDVKGGFRGIGESAKAWIAGAAVAAMYALQRGIQKVWDVTSRWQHSMAEVSTLVDTSTVNMDGLSDGLQDIATEIEGTNWNDLPKALYQTISAGVSASQSLDVVRTAAKSAVAGVTEVSVAVDGITTAINAWGLEAADAEAVSDSFFTAVKAGKTTFDELSNSIGRAAPLAATTNTSLEELLAGVAALTTSGLKTEEAMTAMRGIFQKIIKPTQQAKDAADELGIEFNQAALESQGLYGFLQNVGEAADGNTEVIGRLFEDVEALNGVLALTGGSSEKFAEILGDMDTKAGATTEAFGKMEESGRNIYQLFNNQLNRAIDTFGKTVMPTMINTLRSANDFLEKWRKSAEKASSVEGALSSIGGLYGSDMTGWNYNQLKKDLQSLYDQSQKNVDAYEQENRQLKETIKSYSTWGKGIDGWRQKISDANEELTLRGFALEKNIQYLESQIEAEDTSNEKKAKMALQLEFQRKKLESVNKQLDIARGYMSDLNNEEGGGGEGFFDSMSEKQKQALDQMFDGVQKLDTALGDLGKAGEGSLLSMHMDKAARSVEEYNNKLTRLNNLRDSGSISQQKYEENVKNASQELREQLSWIYNLLKKDLTPEQEKFFKKLFGNLKDTSKEAEDAGKEIDEFGVGLDDLADTVDAIMNVADAFGGIGENARKSLRGVSDLLRGVQNMKDLADEAGGLGELLSTGSGVMSAAIPTLGIAGGVLSIVSGIQQQNAAQAAAREALIDNMEDLKREIARNTEALMQQAVVGGDLSNKQVSEAEAILSQLENLDFGWVEGEIDDIPGWLGQLLGNIDPKKEEDAIIKEFLDNSLNDILDQLAETGIPALEGIDAEFFEGILESVAGENYSLEELKEAINILIAGGEDFEGIGDIIKELENQLGQFGDSLEGAIERFDMTVRLGGDSAQAFDSFISDVVGLVGGENKLTDLLEDVASADSKEERKQLAKEIWDAFQNNPELLGSDLTGSDLQEIIDMIISQGDGSATGSEATDYSRSVQIAKSITDVQANEMIMFLERIEVWTRETAAAVGSKFAQNVSDDVPLPSFSMPIPLPVEVVNDFPFSDEDGDSGGDSSGDGSSGGKGDINIGDVNIGRDGITDEEVDDIGRRIARKLKQEIRSKQF